jgi:hypothetical protein
MEYQKAVTSPFLHPSWRRAGQPLGFLASIGCRFLLAQELHVLPAADKSSISSLLDLDDVPAGIAPIDFIDLWHCFLLGNLLFDAYD